MVKLICSAKSIPLEMVDVDFQNMKTDRAAYPFGQCEWHQHTTAGAKGCGSWCSLLCPSPPRLTRPVCLPLQAPAWWMVMWTSLRAMP